MTQRLIKIIFFLFISGSTFAQNQWFKEDKIASQLKPKTFLELVDSIKRLNIDDWNKVRVAFTWIDRNIKYDWDNYRKLEKEYYSVDETFFRKKGICSNYSEMFKEVITGLGFDCEKVSGYAKGYGYVPNESITGTNHAWNAVKDKSGQWHLFDVTWGSFYFDVDPKIMIYEHLPRDSAWQQLSPPVTKEWFEKTLPDTIYDLRRAFDASIAEFNRNMLKPPCPLSTCEKVKVYKVAKLPDLKILQAPVDKLELGKEYEFKVKGDKEVKLYIVYRVNNKKIEKPLRYSNGIHAMRIRLKKQDPYSVVKLGVKGKKSVLTWLHWEIAKGNI